MNEMLKNPVNWAISALGALMLFIPSTLYSISDKTPVDGLFTMGFPLLFFKKGYFPPMEEFLVFALLANLLLFFAISSGIVLSIKLFWGSLHSLNITEF